MRVPFYTSEDVRGVVEPEEAVGAVREAYVELAGSGLAQPRTKLAPRGGVFTGYFAHLPRAGYSGAYVYTGGFESRDAWFLLALYDAETGEPAAVVDGASLNPLKTGAVGAVGSDALARRGAETLALFGAGLQARLALRAIATVRDLSSVAVYTPSDSKVGFAERADDEYGFDVRPAETPSDALEDADIVHTATTSSEPVFDGTELPDGAHVTAAGQYDAERREVDTTTVERAKYVLDIRQRSGKDAGALIQAVEEGAVTYDHVYAELAEILVDEDKNRTADDEITLFDSGGTAVETTAVGALLHEHPDTEPSSAVAVSPLSDERDRW